MNEANHGREPVALALSVPRLVRGLAAGILLLHALNLAAHAAHFAWGEATLRWVSLVDVDAEQNLPTWFSSGLLALNAAASWLAAASDPARRRAWKGLAFIFALLSADEVATMHERVAAALIEEARAARLAVGGVWAVGGAIVLAFTAIYLRFWIGLPARLRRDVAVAGVVFVSGGLGLEAAAHAYARRHGFANWGYVGLTAAEELLEMTGALLYLRGVLRWIASERSEARIALG
jgi:hypothetical protein